MGHVEDSIGALAADAAAIGDLKRVFAVQRAAHLQEGTPPAEVRIGRIDHPRPLALYFFGDKRQADGVLASTISGGASINDVAIDVLQENLPFGGSGNSGMGNYHAEFGFRTFSHARAVYRGIRADPMAVLRPPYTGRTRRLLALLARR